MNLTTRYYPCCGRLKLLGHSDDCDFARLIRGAGLDPNESTPESPYEIIASLRSQLATARAEGMELAAKLCDDRARVRDEVASRGDEAAAYEACWTRDIASAIRAAAEKERQA